MACVAAVCHHAADSRVLHFRTGLSLYLPECLPGDGKYHSSYAVRIPGGCHAARGRTSHRTAESARCRFCRGVGLDRSGRDAAAHPRCISVVCPHLLPYEQTVFGFAVLRRVCHAGDITAADHTKSHIILVVLKETKYGSFLECILISNGAA